MASSKTCAEIAPFRSEIGFDWCPAIVENGAGILQANRTRIDTEHVHDRLLAEIAALPPELRNNFSGFSNWSVAKLCQRTGLDRAAAERARQRDFSEPGLWFGTDAALAQFLTALSVRKISAQKGGRFLTLSFGANKADRMREIVSQLCRDEEKPAQGMKTIALGDAANDVEMLIEADLGIVIANPRLETLPPLPGEETGAVVRENLPGPAGWNRAVLRLIEGG